MKEIKFYKGGISNFTTMEKNENYFYVVRQTDNTLSLYLGNKIIAHANTIVELTAEIERAKDIEEHLQQQINLLTGGELYLSNFYKKEEVDALLAALNVNFSNYYKKSETYSKVEVDALLSNIEMDDYYKKDEVFTKSEVEAAIAAALQSIDMSNYYTKQEVDEIISKI